MSGYDQFVAKLDRNEIEARAYAWRCYFRVPNAWAIDLPRILEIQLPNLLPSFALRILTREEMPDEEARTWHSVPAIDMREDVYRLLCDGDGRARFTAGH